MEKAVIALKLLAVTDDQYNVKELAAKILRIQDIVDFVHIREKTKSARKLLLLLEILQEVGFNKTKMVIHDRLDVALAADIPSIHLPGHGLPVNWVREKFPFMRIGCSVHSFDEAKQAEIDGADYVMYGHVFATRSKSGIPPRGLTELLEIKKKIHLPVYVIGGITTEKITELKKINVDGIAVMSGIFSVKNSQEAAQQYFEQCSMCKGGKR